MANPYTGPHDRTNVLSKLPFWEECAVSGRELAPSASVARHFEVGPCFGPTGSWDDVVAAVRRAEDVGLDTVSFWDHYHAGQPEHALVCGWSVYGYLAAITSRIRFVPMVICRPNYLLGVLAKESSLLQIASGGRFELGIGAGDYEGEFKAWGVPFPDAANRVDWLGESVHALRRLWRGEQVTVAGAHVVLDQACCTPVPDVPPRIVAGVGNSRRMVDGAGAWADELNVYGDMEIARYARERIAASGRHIALSVFANRPDEPPTDEDLVADMTRWRDLGASRYIMTYGWADDLVAGVESLARAREAVEQG